MIRDDGTRIIVKPEIVLEVAFDSIQKSNRHDSGFALRFPRIKNIREDKSVSDIDSLQKVKKVYKKQTYIKNRYSEVHCQLVVVHCRNIALDILEISLPFILF